MILEYDGGESCCVGFQRRRVVKVSGERFGSDEYSVIFEE
jgi:hypothetical protein